MRIGINGFGRIGRIAFKIIHEREGLEVAGVNDLAPAQTLAHLLKYDSVHGVYPARVRAENDALVVDGARVPVSNEPDPEKLPWSRLEADVVLECTGVFRTREKAEKHLAAGAEKVVLSAPPKSEDIPVIVIGVNHETLQGSETVVSNASCTTNCLAPQVKVLDDAFGVEQGFMTTVHGYTASQNLVDGPHKDLRRARAAAENIIPTSTGAAKAVGKVLPHLEGKLDGMALRVPLPAGSITDLAAVLKKEASVEDIHQAFQKAATEGPLQKTLQYAEEPLVSRDILGNPHACIYDAGLTLACGRLCKTLCWYDNEWGFTERLIDLAEYLQKR